MPYVFAVYTPKKALFNLIQRILNNIGYASRKPPMKNPKC
jgi:hypothetical protein